MPLIFRLLILLFLDLALATACPGREMQPIVLGQSCALSGPAKDLGQEMRAGLLAAFSRINDLGGVKGRQILLISLDDSYEPDRSVSNTLKLIEDNEVFLLIGEVGTPTSNAVVPIIEERRIPLFAPCTGAEYLRTPFRRYVINVRASYSQEMEELAAYLVDREHLTRVACFFQNDAYGYAGLKGIEAALARRGMRLVGQGSYERNTVAVMGALQEIKRSDPQAIVLVGAYAACAEFIKLFKNKGTTDPVFTSISFVGTESLRETLGLYGRQVIVSQVIPYPKDIDTPLVREFIAAMGKYQHGVAVSFTSFEGYLAGRLFAAIAESVPGELSREKFIDTMETVGRFDLGGVPLTYGPQDHQGMDTIYLTTINPTIRRLIHE
jgi:branched-chain amino acid transport system substrate-binding protein